MLKKNLMAAAAVAGLVFAASASAQVYVGASVGQSRWNVDCNGASNCGNHDTAFKLAAGYNFTSNLAVEGTYFDLGKIGGTLPSGFANVGNVALSGKASGFDVAVVGIVPVAADWDLFGKVGIESVKGTLGESALGYNFNQDRTTTVPMFGFGVKYKATKNLAVRADIDTRKVKLPYSLEGNVTNYNIGLEYAF